MVLRTVPHPRAWEALASYVLGSESEETWSVLTRAASMETGIRTIIRHQHGASRRARHAVLLPREEDVEAMAGLALGHVQVDRFAEPLERRELLLGRGIAGPRCFAVDEARFEVLRDMLIGGADPEKK
jgi:hypothetical protein